MASDLMMISVGTLGNGVKLFSQTNGASMQSTKDGSEFYFTFSELRELALVFKALADMERDGN